jgi:citronellol/citronellal dehydrogenase
MQFTDKTVLVSGGSRGIGLAIVKKLAQNGANIVIAAKTITPHQKLPGTIYTAAKEIEELGAKCLPIQCDIRFEEQVSNAVDLSVKEFGGIDICINNASAISPISTAALDMKRYDLMQDINTRGTFLMTKTCLPYLKKSEHAHILTLSPPLDLNDKWFAPHVAYTISKMGMSMLTLGHAKEFQKFSIGVNSLWPLTAIDTAAVRNILGGESIAQKSRSSEIMADAAYEILSKDPKDCTGNFFIDEVLLRDLGKKDFSQYSSSSEELLRDFFIPDEVAEVIPTRTTSIYESK